MGVVIVLGLIVFAVVIFSYQDTINKLLEENKRLKEKIKCYEEKNTITFKENNNEKHIVENYNMFKPEQQTIIKNEKEEIKTNLKNEKEQKNVTILVTGAICIVLAAVVFLVSTWTKIPNVLKTIVLILLTVVFFIGSYIAKEKYKLEKASNVFFYMGMAYIPICLVSISIFKLFGTYLSILGEGKNIYFAIISIVIAVIYYLNRHDKYLLIGSILSQIFGIISFSLIFSTNLTIIGINLLIYNILLMILTKDSLFIKIYNIIPWLVAIITLSKFGDKTIYEMFLLLLMIINFFILEIKKSKKIYSYMFWGYVMSFGTYIILLYDNIFEKSLMYTLILGFIVFIYIVGNIILSYMKRKNLFEALSVITIGILVAFHIENLVIDIIPAYIISTVLIAILIYIYVKVCKKNNDILENLIPIYFIATGINIINSLDGSGHIYMIFSYLTFVVSELFKRKFINLNAKSFIISHIYIALTYLCYNIIISDGSNWIYTILLIATYIYSYFVKRKNIFKYLAYIMSNFAIYLIVSLLENQAYLVYYIPMVTTLVIMWLEKMYDNLQDEGSKIYLLSSEILSFVLIYNIPQLNYTELTPILAIVFAITIMLYNKTNNYNIENSVPLLCIIPAIFNNMFSVAIASAIMVLSVIVLTGISIKRKKWSIYTIFSSIYIMLFVFRINNIYLSELVFLAWSIVHFLCMTNNVQKDVFKFLTFLSVLVIYNTAIEELGIDSYTLFCMLGYIIFAICVLRNIFKKYNEDIDIFEYISYAFIYISAIINYNSELDGIMFGILLVSLIILSYLKGYGALFITTIFAILVNVFLLTRMFWFSIPWWMYLLIIGTVLISFAIKNEANNKGYINNSIDMIKRIKEKIEK